MLVKQTAQGRGITVRRWKKLSMMAHTLILALWRMRPEGKLHTACFKNQVRFWNSKNMLQTQPFFEKHNWYFENEIVLKALIKEKRQLLE